MEKDIKLVKLEDIQNVNLKYAKFQINFEKYKDQFGYDKQTNKILFIRKDFLQKISKEIKKYNYRILQEHMFFEYKSNIMVFKVRPKL